MTVLTEIVPALKGQRFVILENGHMGESIKDRLRPQRMHIIDWPMVQFSDTINVINQSPDGYLLLHLVMAADPEFLTMLSTPVLERHRTNPWTIAALAASGNSTKAYDQCAQSLEQAGVPLVIRSQGEDPKYYAERILTVLKNLSEIQKNAPEK